MDQENWRESVACAKATAEAVARGDDVPHAPAIVAMSEMWRAGTGGTGDHAAGRMGPLEERVRSFLPLAYVAAAKADARWRAADLFERLSTFLAALFTADTHPPADIAAAVRKVTSRAFVDEESHERRERYYFLILALSAAIVFSAPWLFGWAQVVIGVLAADMLFALAE